MLPLHQWFSPFLVFVLLQGLGVSVKADPTVIPSISANGPSSSLLSILIPVTSSSKALPSMHSPSALPNTPIFPQASPEPSFPVSQLSTNMNPNPLQGSATGSQLHATFQPTFPQQSLAVDNLPTRDVSMAYPSSFTQVTTLYRITPLPTTPPSFAPTSFLPNAPPPPDIQNAQITFSNKYDELFATEYDVWSLRSGIQSDLATMCSITSDRIANVMITSNSTGFLVLRFSIQQGWPVYTSEALQNLKFQLDDIYIHLGNRPLAVDNSVFWTQNGTCPVERCQNLGQCNVTTDGIYKCSCSPAYRGTLCEDHVPTTTRAPETKPNYAFLALLILLIIPIVIAVVIGFVFGRRRQQKHQLKKAFDLRDVRTIGPKSMLSLPLEPGIRNQMYDTRSFALAFTDTTFSPTSTDTSPTYEEEKSKLDPAF